MNRVRARREELGMKQADLLAILRQTDSRMDIGTLSRIENGYVLPASEEILRAFERGLQAARDDLFDGITVFAVEGTKAPRAAVTDFVAGFLGYGKQNAIKRDDLCRMMGVGDRQMRDLLAEAGEDGLIICNDQDGQGYYIADTDEELQRQYIQETNRAMSTLRRRSKIRERMRA